MSAFADPEIIRLASDDFVPCTIDDWYQRRRQDDEGRFFVSVANQGPRKGVDGATRQGIYCLTADGELLNFKNAGQSVAATKEQILQALQKFRALPAARREPGGVTVPEPGQPDANFTRTPPSGGLIVRVNARILEKRGDQFEKSTCEFTGGDRASRDFLWLTESEVGELAPGEKKAGDTYSVPLAIANRIARFHLIDNTRGEPDAWQKKEIQSLELTLTVTSRTGTALDLRLAGKFRLSDHAVESLSKRGYEGQIEGRLTYDLGKRTFTRFDAAAIGDHWGCSTFTKVGMRPGKQPLGIAFGLVSGEKPAERIPPQAAREWRAYLGKE